MNNLIQGCPGREVCECYKNPNSWVWGCLKKLKAILEPPQGNYELWAGNDERNTDKKCPLLDHQKMGWCEQYAFEQAVLNGALQRSRPYVVPSPTLYQNKATFWCPDLILFNEEEKKLWVVEVTVIHEHTRNRKSRRGEEKDDINTAKNKLFDNGLIPNGWNLEMFLAILEEGINSVKSVEQYFNLPSNDIVDFITKGKTIPGKLEKVV